MCKPIQNNRATMRIYTKERIAKMSPKDRQNAIDAVKTSASLTVEEKEANLALLIPHSKESSIHRQIQESAADIEDMIDE